MTRTQVILAVLAGVLLIALFYVLLLQPQREELADIEEQIAQEHDQQQQLEAEIARLRQVRETAPETEAELAAAEAIVPHEPGLSAALRQMQLAADGSDVTLQSAATNRPLPTDEQEFGGLSAIGVTVELRGEYFQVVDFLRRIEDPEISPRGVNWSEVAVARGDDYPVLDVTLFGDLYAVMEGPVPPEGAEPDEAEVDARDDDVDEDEADDDPDVDVDVDVEVDADGDDEDEETP